MKVFEKRHDSDKSSWKSDEAVQIKLRFGQTKLVRDIWINMENLKQNES